MVVCRSILSANLVFENRVLKLWDHIGTVKFCDNSNCTPSAGRGVSQLMKDLTTRKCLVVAFYIPVDSLELHE